MAQTLIGAFAKQTDVDAAIEDLRDYGYTFEQIERKIELEVPIEGDEEDEVKKLFTKHHAEHLKTLL